MPNGVRRSQSIFAVRDESLDPNCKQVRAGAERTASKRVRLLSRRTLVKLDPRRHDPRSDSTRLCRMLVCSENTRFQRAMTFAPKRSQNADMSATPGGETHLHRQELETRGRSTNEFQFVLRRIASVSAAVCTKLCPRHQDATQPHEVLRWNVDQSFARLLPTPSEGK